MDLDTCFNASLGSRQYPYQLFVVGGGPAALSIIVRAIRLGVEKDLLGSKCVSVTDSDSGGEVLSSTMIGGMGIVDMNKDCSRFGGGRLVDYIINSNTWCNKFVTNVMKNKPDVIPPENVEGTVLEKLRGCFGIDREKSKSPPSNSPIPKREANFCTGISSKTVSFKPSNIGHYLENVIGAATGPLNIGGEYMCEVGVVCRQLIQEKYSHSSSCIFNYKCIKIEKIDNLWTNVADSMCDGVDVAPVCSLRSDSSSSQSHFFEDTINEAVATGNNNRKSVETITKATSRVGWKITLEEVVEESTVGDRHPKVVHVFASHVVLATGGYQTLPCGALNTTIKTSIKPTMPTSVNPASSPFTSLSANILNKFILSDDVCTEEGARLVERKLLKFYQKRLQQQEKQLLKPQQATMECDGNCQEQTLGSVSSERKKKVQVVTNAGAIVVIGGSHSAFSSAWVCLNKLFGDYDASKGCASDLNGDKQDTSDTRNLSTGSVVDQTAKLSAEADEICESIRPMTSPQRPSGPQPSLVSNSANISNSPKRTNIPIVDAAAASTTSDNPIHIGNNGILLLHRSCIQVFFATRKEALEEGYSTAEMGIINKNTGQIHPFGGLRGDAKELWKKVKRGVEPRIRLQQIKTDDDGSNGHVGNNQQYNWVNQSFIQKLFEEAAVIIWSTGYSTNIIPVVDHTRHYPKPSATSSKKLSPKEVSKQSHAVPLSYWMGNQVEVDDTAQILRVCDDNEKKAYIRKLHKDKQKLELLSRRVAAETASMLQSHSEEKERADEVITNQVDIDQATVGDHEENNSNVTLDEKVTVLVATREPLLDGSSGDTKLSTEQVKTGSVQIISSVLSPAKASPAPLREYGYQGIPVGQLYGCGLGFGLKALYDNGEPDGSSGRADGVAVYLKRAATLILSHVVGTKVFGGGECVSWEHRNNKLAEIVAAEAAAKAKKIREKKEEELKASKAAAATTSSTTSSTTSTKSVKKDVTKPASNNTYMPALANKNTKDITVTNSDRPPSMRNSSGGGSSSRDVDDELVDGESDNKAIKRQPSLNNTRRSMSSADTSSRSYTRRTPSPGPGCPTVTGSTSPSVFLDADTLSASVARLSQPTSTVHTATTTTTTSTATVGLLLDPQALLESVARLSQPTVVSTLPDSNDHQPPTLQLPPKIVNESVNRLSQIPNRFLSFPENSSNSKPSVGRLMQSSTKSSKEAVLATTPKTSKVKKQQPPERAASSSKATYLERKANRSNSISSKSLQHSKHANIVFDTTEQEPQDAMGFDAYSGRGGSNNNLPVDIEMLLSPNENHRSNSHLIQSQHHIEPPPHQSNRAVFHPNQLHGSGSKGKLLTPSTSGGGATNRHYSPLPLLSQSLQANGSNGCLFINKSGSRSNSGSTNRSTVTTMPLMVTNKQYSSSCSDNNPLPSGGNSQPCEHLLHGNGTLKKIPTSPIRALEVCN